MCRAMEEMRNETARETVKALDEKAPVKYLLSTKIIYKHLIYISLYKKPPVLILRKTQIQISVVFKFLFICLLLQFNFFNRF